MTVAMGVDALTRADDYVVDVGVVTLALVGLAAATGCLRCGSCALAGSCGGTAAWMASGLVLWDISGGSGLVLSALGDWSLTGMVVS